MQLLTAQTSSTSKIPLSPPQCTQLLLAHTLSMFKIPLPLPLPSHDQSARGGASAHRFVFKADHQERERSVAQSNVTKKCRMTS
ncbi:hypothetical protein A0H81_01167 [Grifola frondosa]|uniref:Uncharacterized protein n=1 Tax=Grifola frondosa TaxID=5627 RepID=A0A1C7MQB4_GRIFR|nr:hypothetical protein A0H81_01167 [Grifola frondosa]